MSALVMSAERGSAREETVRTRAWKTAAAVLGLTMVTAGGARAQDAAADAKTPPVAVSVGVVISHYEGERKVSSVPYSVMARTGLQTNANMGVQVAVPSNNGAVTYHQIGSNIAFTATAAGDDRYLLRLSVQESSVLPDKSTTVPSTSNVPAFAEFTVTSSVVIRDGETVQFTSGANPLTGQVTKIDISLKVLK
jgi:hypothetical protein